MLSPDLEETLRRALSIAGERSHEFATLEHLLLALIDDEDAIEVLKGCKVDISELRDLLVNHIEDELSSIVNPSGKSGSAANSGFSARCSASYHSHAVFWPRCCNRSEYTNCHVF